MLGSRYVNPSCHFHAGEMWRCFLWGRWSIWSPDPLLGSASFPLQCSGVQMEDGTAAKSTCRSHSGRTAVKLQRGLSFCPYICSDAVSFPACRLVWSHFTVTVNVPLLMKSALLVSVQNKGRGHLSPSRLAQGEDGSVLWVRWGDRSGRSVGTKELGRGEGRKWEVSCLSVQGIPPPALPSIFFQSPTKGSQHSKSETEILERPGVKGKD